MNMEKRKKRRMESGELMNLEGDFNEQLDKTMNEEKTVIAQLHTPSSFYHQLRELLSGNSGGGRSTNN